METFLDGLKRRIGRAWRPSHEPPAVPAPQVTPCATLQEFRRFLAATEAAGAEQAACETSLLRPDAPFSVRGTCAVCRRETGFHVDYGHCFTSPDGARVPNWREQLVCPGCGLNTRMRAAFHFLRERAGRGGRVYPGLSHTTFPELKGVAWKASRPAFRTWRTRAGTTRGTSCTRFS